MSANHDRAGRLQRPAHPHQRRALQCLCSSRHTDSDRNRDADVQQRDHGNVCLYRERWSERGDADEDDRAADVWAGADVRVGRATRSDPGDELPGSVVGGRRQRIRLGSEPDAARHDHFRDVVHLRRESQSVMAVGNCTADRAEHIRRDTLPYRWAGLQRRAVQSCRSDENARWAQQRSSSPMATAAALPTTSTSGTV